MNGRQLADAARQQQPGLKVLFITGYAEGVMAGNRLLDDDIQVMTKPFRLKALTVVVPEMIEG